MPSSPPFSYRIGETAVGSVTYLNGTAEQIARVENVLYNDLPDSDYRLWTSSMERQRALVTRDEAGTLTSSSDVVQIEFTDSDANPGDGAHTYAYTTWSGSDAPIHVKIWESEAKMHGDDKFFRETVAHEFGHVATFLLMEALGEDTVKQKMCDYYGLPVSRWSDPSLPWEKRVIEATAEFFKDVMVPREFRRFDNRSDYRFPAGAYPGWLGLFVKRLYNMHAGSEDGPFFSFTMVDNLSGGAGTGTLSIGFQNGNYDPNLHGENPALNPLRYPVLPVTFEADLRPPAGYVLLGGFDNATFRAAGGYRDLDGNQYASFDTGVQPMPLGTLSFDVPAAGQPGDWFGAITFSLIPQRFKGSLAGPLQPWGTLWADHIWARLPDHERFSAWSPGKGIELPPVDDTRGRPPYPTYFPPYPYGVPATSVEQGPRGTVRHNRGVTGQQGGRALPDLRVRGAAEGDPVTRVSRRQQRGSIRH